MATYTVTTTSDLVDPGDGQLSLREALALADANPGTADAIDFAPEVQGQTIVLAGSQLTSNSDMTIDGGSGVTIDADGKSRVLLAQGGTESDSNEITLIHMTVTGGQTVADYEFGGGIRAEFHTALTLDHTTVSDNSTAGYNAHGGGISGYRVTLTDSTVSGNSTAGETARGGGVSGSYVTLSNSTVSGNSTGGYRSFGAGIFGSYVTLSDSAVSGNSTAGDSAYGGGVFGNVTLSNSTVSGNSTTGENADGGGIFGGTVTLANSTVSGNSTANYYAYGGGVYASTVALANSIVAGNATGTGASSDVAGYLVSNGLNVFSSAVDGSAPSDTENVSPTLLFAAQDPTTGGGLLADNGGPTPTIALRDAPNNPALGRADPEISFATDQRGEARPQPAGTAPDIGAFELHQSDPTPPPVGTTFVVTTTSDVSADDGQLTLREALALADADSLTADRIEFDSAVQGRTITLAGSQLTANSDVIIDGGTDVTIDANQASRVMLVRGFGTDVTLQHLTIIGGQTGADYDGGGGIRAGLNTHLTLDHTTVSGNSTVGYNAHGGGVFGYSVTLTSSTVSGNSTVGNRAYGGGIIGDAVTLADSTVSGNGTVGDDARGGGIVGNSLTLSNSTVSGNSTTGYLASGGGIFGSNVTLSNSTVSSNSTAGDGAYGGGIRAIVSVTLSNSTVSRNSTIGEDADGGGIFGGTLTLANSIVADNTTLRSSSPDIYGSVLSNGHNIFGSSVPGAAPGDLEDVPASLLFVGGLADNGGPTQTIALRDAADNPALAGADPADSPDTDQRGEVRPQPGGTAPDIGAFELNQTAVAYNPVTGTDRGEFLSGTSHADLMRGLGGDDRLWGRPGGDLLFGDAGKDVLAGKEGVDQTTGGDDADRFLYRRPIDAPPDGPVLDQIMDFHRAQHDKVDLRPIDADQTADGNQKFSFIGEQDFTGAGQVRCEEVAGGQFLVSGSTDRDPAPEFAFLVHSADQLEAADFLL